MRYFPYRTDRFQKSLLKLDKPIRVRVTNIIEQDVTLGPYASDPLMYDLKGKREYRVGDYRIIFAICEECRTKRLEQFNGCKDCKKHGRNDVILFDVGHRSRILEEMKRLQMWTMLGKENW